MLSKLSGTTIALIILISVVSTGTLVTLDVLQRSESDDSFTAKVDFSEGTNYYTMIEVDDFKAFDANEVAEMLNLKESGGIELKALEDSEILCIIPDQLEK